MYWSDTYPHELHANVLLLDNKIENWKTGGTKAEAEYWPFSTRWKPSRMKLVDYGQYESYDLGDYKVESKTWIVNNEQEHIDVFEIHAPKWYQQWEHADDYKLGRAY